jgi:hypothetical protein
MTPLETILAEIRAVFFVGKLYYVALHLALSVPDICSSLEVDPDGDQWAKFKANERYVAWCKAYLEPKFKKFTAEDCWAMRGGVVHNRMLFGHPKNRFTRVLFSTPLQGYSSHENTIGPMLDRPTGAPDDSRVLELSLEIFCTMMERAALEWYEAKKDDPIVQKNMDGLVRFRPEGLKPWVVGTPVIA